ncbi:chemotaxis protein CheW [Chitinasiproducens palmae]|uniref:Chemotaxis protein methyltransferase WspC/chemotaxis-related protein WspD n=1 Tax=Chitinasiproducens palmae TaxID=1770053 RepID=A0A1H2PJ61_9BURK|nr:chemotaxis protein CheW [Chitinasiproducens palmae]SDV46390.1 chemotaxis protein methyltransferase WspC/chemotaxis-related protein WspD [Chitinasiproducens palmae]
MTVDVTDDSTDGGQGGPSGGGAPQANAERPATAGTPAMHAVPARFEAVDDCWNRIGVYGDASCERLAEAIHCRNCEVYASAAIRLLDRVPVDMAAPGLDDTVPRAPGMESGADGALAGASDVASTGASTGASKGASTGASTGALNDAADGDAAVIGRFLVFRVGDEWLGLSARAIAQVVPEPPIVPIAKRRGGLRPGIANVAGAPTVALRLARLLEIAERPRQGGLSVVFEHDGHRTLLAVDEVADVITVRALHRLPATLDRALQHYAFATAVWRDRPVGLLDAERLNEGIARGLR